MKFIALFWTVHFVIIPHGITQYIGAPCGLPPPIAISCAPPYSPVIAEWAYGFTPTNLASYGSGLSKTSTLPTSPIGLSAISDNCYEAGLSTAGLLPFLSMVGLEDVLQSGGFGAIGYECSNGLGLFKEDIGPSCSSYDACYGYSGPSYSADRPCYGL